MAKKRERRHSREIYTCPWESTKVRELHWHPRLTKGEAAFRSFVRLRAEEPAASRVIARKFISVIVFLLVSWLALERTEWTELKEADPPAL